MPNDYLDQVQVGDTTYDLQDAAAQADLSQLKSQIQQKANIDGYYESMTVGNAEQLVATVGVEDSAPYNFRTAGGSADIGDRLVDKLVGGTVAWNQWIQDGRAISTSYWNARKGTLVAGENESVYTMSEWSSDATIVTTGNYSCPDHVFFYTADIYPAHSKRISMFLVNYSGNTSFGRDVSANVWNTASGILKMSTPNNLREIQILLNCTEANGYAVGDQDKIRNVMLFDLTQMFGSTIADYIYSLEQATAGAGVAWFRHLFPKDYYAYNAGELMSVQAASHITRGFNQWNPDSFELDASSSITINSDGSLTISNRAYQENYNRFPVVQTESLFNIELDATLIASDTPNTSNLNVYFFYNDGTYSYKNIGVFDGLNKKKHFSYKSTAGKQVSYIAFGGWAYFGTAKIENICINLSWDGERDGEYEPYTEHVYPLDDSLTLRGIPKLDASNNLYYDGDTYESDGTVTRRYGVYTFTGNESITYYSTGGKNTFNVALPGAKVNGFGAMSAKYHWSGVTLIGNQDDKTFIVFLSNAGPRVSFCDNDYTDTAAFASNITGITIIYELDTPTTESADPYQNPQIVDDFGTEEYVDSGVTAATPTRDVAIPVGHETTYQANLRAKLEMAPDSPSDGDGDYIVRQTNGTNEYAKLVIPAELPTNPTENGTYHLKATVSNGTTTLTWEADT